MGQGTFRAGLNASDPTYVTLSKEIVATKGKELLVSEDAWLWWTKSIVGNSAQLVFAPYSTALSDPLITYDKRSWDYSAYVAANPGSFPGGHVWSEVIASALPTQGQPMVDGAKYFISLSDDTVMTPTSRTHAADVLGDTADLSNATDYGAIYSRAQGHMNAHNYSELYWQDVLEIDERVFYSDPFSGDTTGIDHPLSSYSSIAPPWDLSDYNIHTDFGLVADGAGKTGPCEQYLGGWLGGVGTSAVQAGMASMSAQKGEFKVDRTVYYAWVSVYLFAQGVPVDAANKKGHFISQGVATPGNVYASPAPITSPFPAIYDSVAGQMVGERVCIAIGETPLQFCLNNGLTGVIGWP